MEYKMEEVNCGFAVYKLIEKTFNNQKFSYWKQISKKFHYKTDATNFLNNIVSQFKIVDSKNCYHKGNKCLVITVN